MSFSPARLTIAVFIENFGIIVQIYRKRDIIILTVFIGYMIE